MPVCTDCDQPFTSDDRVSIDRDATGQRRYRHGNGCMLPQRDTNDDADADCGRNRAPDPPQSGSRTDGPVPDDDVLAAHWTEHGDTLRQGFLYLLEQLPAGKQRERHILTRRLGLDGDPPQTLTDIGVGYGLTRERIRQLEARGLTALVGRARRAAPDSDAARAGRLLAEHLTASSTSSSGPPAAAPAAHALHAADAAFPLAYPRTAARAVLVLAGMLAAERDRLTKQVLAEADARERRLTAAGRRTATAQRASARLHALLDLAHWPTGIQPEPFIAVPQQRVHATVDSPVALPHYRHAKSGQLGSTKLGRDVGYDSLLELQLITLLEAAPDVVRYTEQPLALQDIGPDGHGHLYYPDLLIELTDGRILLLEVKPITHMASTINQSKFAAARSLAAARGWGFLVTDGRRSEQLLHDHLPPAAAAAALAALVERPGGCYWDDVRAVRDQHGLSTLDLQALIVRSGWRFTVAPYRLRATARPA